MPPLEAYENLIWKSIDENRAAFFESELVWARSLRSKLKKLA